MNNAFLKKICAACASILPIAIIVIILNFAIEPIDKYSFGAFAIGAACLIAGSAMYSIGVDAAIEPIGEHVGNGISHTKNIGAILGIVFAIGCVITVAEPSLSVLASQVSINDWTLILTVSLGVGLFMVAAVLRMALKISLSVLFAASYLITFLLVIFADRNVIPLAFDSGGVTTGLITVPFIMALASGISSAIGGNNPQENSFGIIGICSVGPIIVVLILSLAVAATSDPGATAAPAMRSARDVADAYMTQFPIRLKGSAIALAPIIAMFLAMQIATLRLPRKRLIKILIGLCFAYVGITTFLAGANAGFMSIGAYIGGKTASVSRWLIIPVGAAIGGVIALAEPAIRVLNKQIEEITGGTISRRAMLVSLIASMSVAVGLAMLRIAFRIDILWILVPGYAIAVALSFFVPKIFTGIAFDSGGVASGPMTATFLLPFAVGACAELGGNVLTDAFGIIGFVALSPLVVLQTFGLAYRIKTTAPKALRKLNAELLSREGRVIELDWRSLAPEPGAPDEAAAQSAGEA